jgi:homoserine O-acetyltransferase
MPKTDYSLFNLGDIKLQSGIILKNAQIAYKTYGKLNKKKNNVIVYPTWFTGFISDNEWLIGKHEALNPNKYFIIVVAAFGNGQSTSPSNTGLGPTFPNITLYDNVINQYKLVTKLFGINKIEMVVGWSMGAQQTFQWGCLFPDMIKKIAPICGSSKTAQNNFVFLEGVKYALINSNDFHNGYYETKPYNGLQAVARVYSGWGFSQPFYNNYTWRELGYTSLEDFEVGFWQSFFNKRDANNLLCMLWTWQNADISDNKIYNKNQKIALESIKAKSYVMPCNYDLYFTPETNIKEVSYMPNAKIVEIYSIWGHFSADGLNKKDTIFINKKLKKLLKY